MTNPTLLSSDPSDVWPTDGKLRRAFVMFSNGEVPEVDRLAVIMELMREMNDNERRATLGYVADFCGCRVFQK